MNLRLLPCRWSVIALSCALGACGGDSKGKGTPPASVSNPTTEAALTTITLTAEAVQRLGIQTEIVESITVRATRTVGGEVMSPPGRAVTVSAPVAGTVVVPQERAVVATGSSVSAGTELLRLVPLPGDRDLLRSGEALKIAEARFAQASAEAQRVAKLHSDRLVSARDMERAQAELTTARAELDAARGQVGLAQGTRRADDPSLTSLRITAPMSGVVQLVHVAPGQSVAAGAPLVDIAQLDRVWIRVPLYAGDVRNIVRGEVTVSTLGITGARTWRAVPVVAPRRGDPGAASVDLYYEVASAGALRSGERVTVSLPSGGAAGAGRRVLAVPMSAVVYDIYGGTWTYVARDSLHVVRTRVELGDIVDGRAVIVRGLTPGVRVVVAGAAELFGTEFGPGK